MALLDYSCFTGLCMVLLDYVWFYSITHGFTGLLLFIWISFGIWSSSGSGWQSKIIHADMQINENNIHVVIVCWREFKTIVGRSRSCTSLLIT